MEPTASETRLHIDLSPGDDLSVPILYHPLQLGATIQHQLAQVDFPIGCREVEVRHPRRREPLLGCDQPKRLIREVLESKTSVDVGRRLEDRAARNRSVPRLRPVGERRHQGEVPTHQRLAAAAHQASSQRPALPESDL